MQISTFFSVVVILFVHQVSGSLLSQRLLSQRPNINSLLDSSKLFGECRYGEVSIAEVAAGVPDLSILVEALKAADLLDALADKEFKGTVFAPTNKAFQDLLKLLGLNKKQLLKQKDLLTQVLQLHASPEVVIFSEDLFTGQVFQTLEGSEIVATEYNSEFYIFSPITIPSKVIIPDVAACNAVVHVIDRVLLPNVDALPDTIAVPASIKDVPFPDDLCRTIIIGNLLISYRCEIFGPGFLEIVRVGN